MLQYAVNPAVLSKEKGLRGDLHILAVRCDVSQFIDKIDSLKEDEYDYISELTKTDGTTILMSAAYSGCVDIVKYIIYDLDVDVDETGTL